MNGFVAASNVLAWLRAWYGQDKPPDAIDLDVVRQILPDTRYGKNVREIKPPMPSWIDGCEGMLVCNPENSAEWGIFYNPKSSPERQRFTIAHELGHFILHREQQVAFRCSKESVYAGVDDLQFIEREADDFAGNLLIPGDTLRAAIARRPIDLHLLSELAKRFQVSFEALCIRFIKYTEQRAILLCWDNGFLKYEWRSKSAKKTRARIRRTDNPQEPLPDTVAAEPDIEQEWDGIEMSAATWCPEEASYMKLREFKHSYNARDRVLTLLMLESAEPRARDSAWREERQGQ